MKHEHPAIRNGNIARMQKPINMATKLEHLKGAAYTAITMHQSVKDGSSISYEDARATVLKWMNFGLEEGQQHDMTEYFQFKDQKLDPTIRQQFQEEAWEALEYFNLI